MFETKYSRIFIISILLAGQMVLLPLFAQQPVNQEAGVFPSENEFIVSSDRYIGERVVTGGVVKEISPIVIQIDTTQGKHRVSISGSELNAKRGDKIRVFGILTTPKTIRALNAFVVPQSGLWYTWTISFLAGLWVLLRLIRHWTINIPRLSFHPRKEPIVVRDTILSPYLEEKKEDA